MRILGIDPGSNATGYGVIDAAGGGLVHVAHGVLRPPRTAAAAGRLAALLGALEEVVQLYTPEQSAVEQIFVARGARSALVLGQARGVALAVLGARDLPVVELASREVKQAVVGTGSATKAQVQAMVRRLLSLESAPPTDASDALAVAICHAHSGKTRALGRGRSASSRGRSRARSAAEWTRGQAR